MRLKSWPNQYLTRTSAAQCVTVATVSPDGDPAVTTYSTGFGNEWTSELAAGSFSNERV